MGWDIIGTKETVKATTRGDFVKYMNTLYSADNMVVVVAGGIDEKESVKLVGEYFNPMKKFDIVGYPPVVENQTKPEVHIKLKKTEQIHIALGVRTVPNESPEKYPLNVLSAIFGGGMSSRLFHEVREKRGLAYYVRSSSDHYLDCGTFVTTAGIDPKRVTDAVKVMLDEYNKATEGTLVIKKDELKKAKEFLKGHMVLELEDSRAVAGYYAHQELLEKSIENPDEVIQKIDVVNTDELNAVGKKFFENKGLNLALIGNFEDRQALENLLQLSK